MGKTAEMKLSIVTTMYNSAKYLPKCVDSLLNQDLSEDDYEIILVNDGSPDNSLELAEQYASCHKNIKVLSHANKGLAGARNTGLEAAQGEYLCFVDPDDYVRANIYGKLLRMMDEGHLDMLRFNYDMVNEDYQIINKPKGTVIDYSPQIMDGETFLDERLGYGCFVWSYVYRLSFLRKIGIMFKEGAYFDDTNWFPRVCCKAERIDSVDFVGYYYLQRSGSLVNSMTEEAQKKKVKGQVDLIAALKDFTEQTHSQKVKHWCHSMISVTVLAMMSFAVQESNKDVVKMVSGLPVFPLELRLKNTTRRVKSKLRLINWSPKMYYKLYQLFK
jgi:glycosyltransferase involved in cell wall biosynthesis